MSGHVINNTTGGDLQMNIEERLSCLDAFPDVASLDGFVGEVRDYPRPACRYSPAYPVKVSCVSLRNLK